MKIEERDGELIVEGRRTWSGLSFTPKQLDVFWKENYKTWNG
jgi:hypothetical protein